MAGDSSSPAEQGEDISWASPSAAIGRGVSTPQLTLVTWQKGDFANIAEETLLLYKTVCAEMPKESKSPAPRFKILCTGAAA